MFFNELNGCCLNETSELRLLDTCFFGSVSVLSTVCCGIHSSRRISQNYQLLIFVIAVISGCFLVNYVIIEVPHFIEVLVQLVLLWINSGLRM